MAVAVDMKALLEAGVHFGHKTSRWHPKMAPYIHSKRQETHIIDLVKTAEGLEKALPFLTKTAASGKKVLFVGTKKQHKDIVKLAAESADQPYVTERWIGGMLTNVLTITSQIIGMIVMNAYFALPMRMITVVPTHNAIVASSWLAMPKSGHSELMPPSGSVTP